MRKLNFLWTLVAAVALSMGFASCTSDTDDVDNGGGNGASAEVAYLSVSMLKQTTTGGTRASSEEGATPDESAINELYVLLFNDSEEVLPLYSNNLQYYVHLSSSAITTNAGVSTTNSAIQVSGDTKYIFLVANPNDKLKSVITSLDSRSTYSTFNAAIEGIKTAEVTGSSLKNFTMVSTPDDSGESAGNTVNSGLVDISTNVFVVGASNGTGGTYTESSAAAAAQSNKAKIKIERLSSKIVLTEAVITVTPESDGATFNFVGWTVDGRNTTYYPFATKKLFENHISTTNFYKFNFYTQDPNYSGNSGVAFNTTNATTYDPMDAFTNSTVSWSNSGTTAYMVENTMEATAQKFGNMTRLVIKGKYYPKSGWSGDWFSFAGTNYKDLAALQTAYSSADPDSDLALACESMLAQINSYNGTSVASFGNLTQTDLDAIQNGGEVLKAAYAADTNPYIIRWYQKGVCYYYYQNVHNNTLTDFMAEGKYGVVRNNYYSLTLTSVDGAGTPWYPTPVNPGPGDPGEEDDVDAAVGYLGIEIEPGPWVYWTNNIGV